MSAAGLVEDELGYSVVLFLLGRIGTVVLDAKLDLAKAYVELGDKDSAKNILGEVIAEGNEDQKKQAQDLLDQV